MYPHGDYEKRIKNHLDEIVKQKKVRPSNAPTTRIVKLDYIVIH
jgi:hypothetical protein